VEGANVPITLARPTRSDTARREFELAIGHGLHRESKPSEIESSEYNAWVVRSVLAERADAQSCGWWWCSCEDIGAVEWKSLATAVDTLAGLSIDPWGEPAARIAQRYQVESSYRDAKADFDSIMSALGRVRSKMKTRDGQVVWHELYEQARMVGGHAHTSKPDGTKRDLPLVHALEAATTLTTNARQGANAVAAVLYLYGFARRMRFDIFRRRVAETNRRRK
jgi:hypothetical protein